MAETNWYYAKGDKQIGPVNSAQLKELFTTNQLPPETLVFKEGMKEWVPATKVSGLVSEPAPPVKSNTASNEPVLKVKEKSMSDKAKKRVSADYSIDIFNYGRAFGHPLLIVGILLVLFAKGCDSLGARSVVSSQAAARLEESQFDDKYELMEIEAQDEMDKADDTDSLTKAREKLVKISKDKKEDRSKLQKGHWRTLKNTARDARYNNQMWGYWREMIFVFGSMVLTLGLVGVGFTGEGADRWICLIMLAIITFSIYVIGSPWLASIVGQFR